MPRLVCSFVYSNHDDTGKLEEDLELGHPYRSCHNTAHMNSNSKGKELLPLREKLLAWSFNWETATVESCFT